MIKNIVASLAYVTSMCVATVASAQTVNDQPIGGLRDSQAILNFSQPDAKIGDPAIILTATSTSGLPVTYASRTTAVCKTVGSTLTFVAAGNCILLASQAGNAKYIPGQKAIQFNVVAKVVVPPPPPPVVVEPTLILTSPVGGAVLTVGVPVDFTAAVQNAQGPVEFFVCGMSAAKVGVAPYTFKYTPTATDAACVTYAQTPNAAKTGFNYAPSITNKIVAAPVVQPIGIAFDSPEPTALMVGVPFTFSVATTGANILYVEFHACDVTIAKPTAPPYTYTWTPTTAMAACEIYAEISDVSRAGFAVTAKKSYAIAPATVVPPPPPVTPPTDPVIVLKTPVDLSVYTLGSSINLSASVSGPISYGVNYNLCNGDSISVANPGPNNDYATVYIPTKITTNCEVSAGYYTLNYAKYVSSVKAVVKITEPAVPPVVPPVVPPPPPVTVVWSQQNKYFAQCQKCPSTQMFETATCPGFLIGLIDPALGQFSSNMKWVPN